jgi:hypothetical protein
MICFHDNLYFFDFCKDQSVVFGFSNHGLRPNSGVEGLVDETWRVVPKGGNSGTEAIRLDAGATENECDLQNMRGEKRGFVKTTYEATVKVNTHMAINTAILGIERLAFIG